MRISSVLCICSLALIATSARAESKNPADYPLRIHIFSRTEMTFYRNRHLDETRGDGRANLFQNSEARAVDFSFVCSERITPSFGFETYRAKWKKPGEELVVLFPVFSKANAFFTCNLKTRVKDYTYITRNGRLDSIPVPAYKAWMVQHEYDPEHDKNMPVRLQRPPAPANQSPVMNAPVPATQGP